MLIIYRYVHVVLSCKIYEITSILTLAYYHNISIPLLTTGLLQKSRYLHTKHRLHLLDHLLIQFRNLRQILYFAQCDLKRPYLGKITPGQIVPTGAHYKFTFEVVDEFALLLLSAPWCVRQLLSEVVDYEGVDLDGTGTLD